ncbi:MAG: flippase-like domain-containing protein, partial [Treponema sp.]|nr:flippase-like domain-containing protein [Treponema sp.]
WYLLLAAFMVIVCIGTQGFSFTVIFKAIGYKVSHWKGFVYANVDYYFSSITPSASGGQPSMMFYMAKDGIPVAASGITTFFFLLIYNGSLLVLGTVFLIFMPWLAQNSVIVVLLIIGYVVNIVLLSLSSFCMFVPSVIRRLGMGGIRLLGKLRIFKDPGKWVNNLENSLEEYKRSAGIIKSKPMLAVKVFLLVLIQRFALLSVTFFVYKALRLSGGTYLEIVGAQAIATLCVCILPLPGGVGAAENVFLSVFKNIFPVAFVLPAMLLSRGISFYFCLIFSGIISLINHISLRRRKQLQLTVDK